MHCMPILSKNYQSSLRAILACSVNQINYRLGSNFINSKTAAQLWQSVTPHDQKQHTGGKRLIRKAVKDLNLGRPVGTGKLGIMWPGLNAPVKIQHYNETLKDAFDQGSNEAPIPGSHGLTKSWMQSHSAAKELITSKRQSPMTETAQHSTIDSGTGKERSERSRSPGAQRSKSHRIQSKRNFSTASLSNVNDCNPCLNGVRSCSTGAGGIPGGNPRMSRFNRVRVDQALGSVKDLQKAQAVKFDAADKRVRKRSYSAPLSIRGWTSKSLGGLSVGAPDPKGVVDYKGFQTKILEVKRVCVMKGRYGRCYRKWVLVVCGNYNGLIGYAFARADQLTQAVRVAKNSASKKLVFVERNHNTIFTDATVDVDRTTVHMRRMQPGGGLKCSRVIREIVQLAGITDLRAKIEGPTNTLKVVKAVFEILSNQKTYQQIADEKKLNVVMFRDDIPYYPILLASPQDGHTLPGTNLTPEGELSDEELRQTVYDYDYKLDKHEKIKRFYGLKPNYNAFRRPGILDVPSIRAAHKTEATRKI